VSGQGRSLSGHNWAIAGMPGVATAVELYGEGGSDKEERLELRAVSGRGWARQGPGPATANFSRDWGNRANGLPRTR
jgi:hypothetical protein